MPEPSLRFFGPPLLEAPAAPAGDGRRKSLALLAFLCLEGRPLGRDTLASLLWPECGEERARANLRRCLFSIKAALGGDSVRSERERLCLGEISVDVGEFRAKARGCGSHPGVDPSCPACLRSLEEAEALYRGPFLEGFTLAGCRDFDDWQLDREAGLREEHAAVLRRLAEARALAGDAEGAAAAARRLVGENRYDQASRRLLLRLLAAAGRWEEAELEGRDCVRFLAEELGAGPDPRTQALLQAVRARDPRASLPEGDAAPRRRPRPLPLPATSFVARERELAELASLLRPGGPRVVTVTGPGGIGKTRLAVEAARAAAPRFADGAAFVDLSPLQGPGHALSAIAASLGLAEAAGSRLGIEDQLSAFLAGLSLLLVLDDFERVVEEAPAIARLSAASPGLAVLVTSREPLRIGAERVFRVPPLGAPESGLASGGRRLDGFPSVRLFVERARAARPGFELDDGNAEAVARLCSSLDGLPLAIELAAARLRLLEPRELLARLSNRLELLGDGSRDLPERQRNLRSAIAWSHDLLNEAERKAFARLSAFSGGFDLDAAEAVIGPTAAGRAGAGQAGAEKSGPERAVTGEGALDLVSSLADKCLLSVGEALGRSRFSMLETIRAFALERLETEGGGARARHAAYFLGLAEKSARLFRGPEEAAALARLDLEAGNLRLALAYFAEEGDAAGSLRLAAALHWHRYRRGRFAEGRAELEAALALPESAAAGAPRDRALLALGWLRFVRGDWAEAKGLYLAALEGFSMAKEAEGECLSLAYLGVAERWLGERGAGVGHGLEAIARARAIGEPGLLSSALIWGYATTGGKRIDEGQGEGLLEALGISRDLGDLWGLAHSLEGLGDYLREEGAFGEAAGRYDEALEAFGELGDDWMRAWTLEGLGGAALGAGEEEKAEGRLGESLALFEALGDRCGADYVRGLLRGLRDQRRPGPRS